MLVDPTVFFPLLQKHFFERKKKSNFCSLFDTFVCDNEDEMFD